MDRDEIARRLRDGAALIQQAVNLRKQCERTSEEVARMREEIEMACIEAIKAREDARVVREKR
jgi:hypothetical protein